MRPNFDHAVPSSPTSRRPTWLGGAILLWACLASSGFLAVAAYHSRPDDGGSPVDRWPSCSGLPLDDSLPTLLIFLHPLCPCSSASMDELGQVAARCRGRFAAHLVTYRPDAPPEGWVEGEGRPGASIPGLARRADPGGRTALAFGVATSGHVLLFDPSGRRLFSGGITVARGHRGENPGLDGLIACLLGGEGGGRRGPVFGCPILEAVAARSAESTP